MNDLISTYLNNGGCLSHFEFDEDTLNKDVLTSLNSYLTNIFSGPSDNYMITYIRNSHFSFVPINNDIEKEMSSLYEHFAKPKFVHIAIDGKKLNDNIYYCNGAAGLSELYYNIKKYNKETLFEFFTRVEISHYTKEEADKYNEDYVKYNYTGDKRKVGQKYLKETDVIINLRTGEEVNIEIPKWRHGYIVYGKYYKPMDKHELYSLETSEKIFEYGYASPIETKEHVIFPSKDNFEYSSKGKAILLNKETGNISYID